MRGWTPVPIETQIHDGAHDQNEKDDPGRAERKQRQRKNKQNWHYDEERALVFGARRRLHRKRNHLTVVSLVIFRVLHDAPDKFCDTALGQREKTTEQSFGR